MIEFSKHRNWLLFIGLNACFHIAHAESQYEIGANIFVASLKGDAQYLNVDVDIDKPIDALFNPIDAAISGYYSYHTRCWRFDFKMAYHTLTAEDSSATNGVLQTDLYADIRNYKVEGFLGYHLFEQAWLHVGLRYIDIDLAIGAESRIFSPTIGPTPSKSRNWYDFVLGVSKQWQLTPCWRMDTWIDIGLNSNSESLFAQWQIGYQIIPNLHAKAGYYVYYFEHGDDNVLQGLNNRLTYHGPMLGVGYLF